MIGTARRLGSRGALAALVLLAGCRSPVGVDEVGYERVYHELTRSALDGRQLSELSEYVLAAGGLERTFRGDPDAALRALHARALDNPGRPVLFALAESSYLTARRRDSRQHYLLAALYAYAYLFDPRAGDPPNVYDPHFRTACDLYNRGLARALLDTSGEHLAASFDGGTVELPVGRLRLSLDSELEPATGGPRRRILPADAYTIRGLRARVRLGGLGVPLITEELDRGPTVFSRRLPVPVTAFLRLEGTLEDLSGEGLRSTLELHSGFDPPYTEVGGERVPLEVDLSAPLAYALEESPLWAQGVRTFITGREDTFAHGLYRLAPHRPGRIPVVFVHGTASVPAWWAETFNGLQLDPVLRERCEFWFFVYATGNPILYSAARLRETLDDALRELDPTGADEMLSRMVVVGHSQGGTLARLLVSSSGERFWDAVSPRPFDELELTAEETVTLRDSFFFDARPYVERVVFICTPHRGSFLAASWIGRLSSKLVHLSGEVRSAIDDLFRRGVLPRELSEQIPTSVTNMDPDNRLVRTVAETPIDPAVTVHSIIAVEGDGVAEQGNDGVVAYTSAHLEGAASELVVRASHSCQGDPRVVLEVRRILREHLEAIDGPEDPGDPAASPR